ncbi:hypothetical protein JUJ52_19705 [Virgibacillus sp. AGTR]|uniref:hypothetical protein n=1 Tax=Virgibacillus sp. AGTR TaxID=2812055 RepID=UPI001D1676F7|nr:hypothetical protein [Virgibacillus sp. AGTR]MCC2252159.1 hypothetical protein [Virgibacillus sp. AGTR]
MYFNVLGKKLRPKSCTITYRQIETYLAQKNMTHSLIQLCVRFLKARARENGEVFVGSRTMRTIIEGTWHLTEHELEAVYHKDPIPIRQYVRQVTTEPDMPSMQEIIRPVEPYSMQAKQAYIFLSESALRAVLRYDVRTGLYMEGGEPV